ncbi:MAG: IS110 family transposase, partial [Verrucomicrobia bacterium]|nr:IS110 family transposase [Verrucomicrobiota bacterium]
WQRILYRCWQNNEPYDESRYIECLRKRGSPLCKIMDQMGLFSCE